MEQFISNIESELALDWLQIGAIKNVNNDVMGQENTLTNLNHKICIGHTVLFD